MLLCEIFNLHLCEYDGDDTKRIVVTRRFLDDLPNFTTYPGVTSGLARFVDYRKTHLYSERYNRKDGAYAPTSPLKGLWHCHIVLGKAIVVYKTIGNEIRFMRMIVHDEEEGNEACVSLANYCNGLKSSDFIPYPEHVEHEQEHVAIRHLQPHEIEEIKELFLGMLVNDSDRKILENAVRGNFTDFIDFLKFYIETDMTDDELFKAVCEAFKGENNLKTLLDRSLKHSQIVSDEESEEESSLGM